jgi:hypothetical protein
LLLELLEDRGRDVGGNLFFTSILDSHLAERSYLVAQLFPSFYERLHLGFEVGLLRFLLLLHVPMLRYLSDPGKHLRNALAVFIRLLQ